jgi:hypothetical protein
LQNNSIQSSLQASAAATADAAGFGCVRTAMLEKKRDSKDGLAEAMPHYHGHRERLR